MSEIRKKYIYSPCAAANYLKKCRGRSRGPKGACGKLEHGKRVDGSSVRMCFACGRSKSHTTIQRRRLAHHGVLEMGRIERG